MNHLFDLDGFLGASNGHYLVVDTRTKSKFYGFKKFENCINPATKGKMQKQLLSIINEPEKFDWRNIPTIPEDSYRECHECSVNGKSQKRGDSCRECGGDGELTLESDYNDYTVDCLSCGGHGDEYIGWEVCPCCNGTKKHLNFVPLKADGLHNDKWDLNSHYLQQFSIIPDCKIAWCDDWEMYAARFDGGAAIIMPMRT
jgi:RecJ-like exonuclease